MSALRRPEGRNARQLLVTQGSIVALLIAGISWLAHVTHATPYVSGYPTVLAQEARTVFGSGVGGSALFYAVQAGTAAILFTGGNTSFSGFPFLASFVAEDSFLPRWLTKRGHRLVFSNGIITLTVISLVLGVTVGFRVNGLIPFYAIGVFTGFSMAGFGMARYYRRNDGPGWRRHRAIGVTGAIYTALVVAIFAVVKFTEGAWLILIVFPVMVYAFIRLNREYRMEAEVLAGIGGEARPAEPLTYARRTAYVLIDQLDLATLAALRYARSLRPTTLRAVHFVIDNRRAAALREDWLRAGTGITLDLIETPDRRIAHAAAELVSAEAALPGVGVTVILPRRSFAPLLGRLLHDGTADRIAAVVSRIPHAAATIVPFDVHSKLEELTAARAAPSGGTAQDQHAEVAKPPVPPIVIVADGETSARGQGPPVPIGSITRPGRTAAEGRVRSIELRPVEKNTVLEYEIDDSTGQLTVQFYGRSHIPGVECGSRILVRGMVSMHGNQPVMTNPAYELLAAE